VNGPRPRLSTGRGRRRDAALRCLRCPSFAIRRGAAMAVSNWRRYRGFAEIQKDGLYRSKGHHHRERLTALYGRQRQLDRVLASVPTRQSVWPDNGSQRLGRIIGQFDPDALLKPVFDYTPRAQNVVPFDLLNSISVTHRSSVARSITRQYCARTVPQSRTSRQCRAL
jgi:hypothetical protein